MVFKQFENLVDPYPEVRPVHPPARLIAFVWAGTQGVRRLVVTMTVLTACIGAFEALLFSILGGLVDRLGHLDPHRVWDAEGHYLLVLAALLAASPVLVGLQNLVKHQALAGNFPMRLRWNFHRLMLGQSMGFYSDEFAGRVAAKVMQTALAVRDTVMSVTDILVFAAIYFLTMTLAAAAFDRLLAIPLLVWLCAYIVTLRWFVPRLAAVARAQADARSLMTGRITDAYTNIATVKLFSHAQREARFAREAMQEFLSTVHGQMRLITDFEVVIHLLNMILVGGTAGVGIWLYAHDRAGVGALAAATAMALRLNGISQWIMWEMTMLFENIGTVQDGLNTIARPHIVVDRPDARVLEVSRGEVRFEHVSFSYDGKRNVIDDLNVTIRPGEKIGLVGRSGAGKSTFVNLLLRFYDVTSGRILIGGQDIALVTQNSLRQQVGMVTQDTSLLHRTVRENILYGRPEAGDIEMRAAAKRAEADGFIAELVDRDGRTGFDAQVGERGVKLSGGQRQRIAIARVMLKDAPILLLDEATSALDSEVEAAIQSSLYRLMEGKTVVAIAHRLSTIAAMDRLIVMDRGRVVEEGDHRSLLARGGLYARLWAHQSGGFLGELVDDEDDDAAERGTVALS